MRTPIRSLMEPPGFMNSSFARISLLQSRAMRERRTSGVEPTVESTESWMVIGGELPNARTDDHPRA